MIWPAEALWQQLSPLLPGITVEVLQSLTGIADPDPGAKRCETVGRQPDAIVPHLLAMIVLRTYMPGAATGLLLNLPLGTWLMRDGLSQQWITLPRFIWVAPMVALALVAAIPLSFAASRRFFQPR